MKNYLLLAKPYLLNRYTVLGNVKAKLSQHFVIAVKPFIESFQRGKATVFALIDVSQLRVILWPGIVPAPMILKHGFQSFHELCAIRSIPPGLFNPHY